MTSEHAPSLYAASADAALTFPALADSVTADVAIIGGGYTGLSAALHLAEAGTNVAVIEAREVGWGASGRAFGQVVPYLKHDHTHILAHFGADRGQRHFGGGTR